MTKKMPDRIFRNFIYRRIWTLTKRQPMNAVFLFIGGPGKGKSTAALKWGEDLDPDFSVERVCFDSKEFFKLLNEGDSNGKLTKGSVIIFDEAAGSRDAIDSRNSLSHSNKMIAWLSTISRAKQWVIIYCSPLLSQLDKRVRLIGVRGICNFSGVDFNEKKSIALFYWYYVSSMSDKGINPKARLKMKSGKLVKIQRIRIPLPTPEINKAYKKKKNKFINTKIAEWTVITQAKQKSQHTSLKEYYQKAMKIIDKLKAEDGEISTALIRIELNVGVNTAGQLKSLLTSNYG